MSLISTISAASQRGLQSPFVIQGSSLDFIFKSPSVVQEQYFGGLNNGEGSAAGAIGGSLSLTGNGDRIAIGAEGGVINYDPFTLGDGFVFVYVKNGSSWTLETTLSRGGPGARFGAGVSISKDGNYLAVGSPAEASNSGRVHIYSRSGTTWSYMTSVSGGGAAGDSGAVALNSDGSYLMVGVYNFDSGGISNRGKVQFYNRNGAVWSLQQEFIGPNATNFRLGRRVAIDDAGAKGIASGPGTGDPLTGLGGVYLYQRDTNTNVWSDSNAPFETSFSLRQRVDVSNDGNIFVFSGETLGASPGNYTRFYNWSGTSLIYEIPKRYIEISLDESGNNFYADGELLTRSGNTWTTTSTFAPSNLLGPSGPLSGVSISADASYVASAYQKDIDNIPNVGEVYIWSVA